jgi:sugar phosphate isomerase/epimerase
MSLSITTDYLADTGCPEDDLRRIAEQGFTHIHWCHQWNTDFVYDAAEIDAIGRWLKDFGLRLLDLHASNGKEKCWTSPREHERQAGLRLVENRIDMTRRLGADAVVMHVPGIKARADHPGIMDRLRRSLDDLAPYAARRGVRIAVENGHDNIATIRELFSAYGPEYLGLCWDSGHGNLIVPDVPAPKGLDALDLIKERLLVLHIHDNDGANDRHRVPFTGTVDWPRLASLIARSGYRKCVSMESNVHQEENKDPVDFLRRARAAGERLASMIAEESARLP